MQNGTIEDELIGRWRDAGALLCTTNRNSTTWGNRYLYRGLSHMSNDETRRYLRDGAEVISAEGIVALLEVHGVGAIEPPLVDGWGRDGLLVMLGDGPSGDFRRGGRSGRRGGRS